VEVGWSEHDLKVLLPFSRKMNCKAN